MEEQREESFGRGILKASKTESKALSAEEEARRREAVREALRGKIELEKRALKIVERLLEGSVAEDFLIDCARFITPANYKDTIEERSIAKLCGYPICPNKLGEIPKQQFKISTKTNKVYDITERKLYCSNFCYKASKQFEVQLAKTPLWLREHESPDRITLMKKGDGGSSGEEVKLTVRRLQEEDIENPSPTQIEDSHKSVLKPEDSDQSDNSENEQEFVSSVVSKKTGPKVHWGDLPKHNEEKTQRITACEGKKTNAELEINGNEAALDEATKQLNLCSLSGNISEPKNNSKIENLNNKSKKEDIPPQNIDYTSVNITQVGMSKKGAAGLRNLLIQHRTKPSSVRQKLLECLKKTLREWGTDETVLFLLGSEHSLGKPFGGAMEEEELDEDDLEEEEGDKGDEGGEAEATAGPPDYETLRREAEQMKQRVKAFYKGTLVLEDQPGTQESAERPIQEPSLPLVDSKAQHVIQKKITVEKLSSCLKNIVGSLGLTMSDISTDLNNLVRTFRFTNTNIIHKTPEWTLIAVVLLHLLSEVSPLIRAALEQPSSVQYLNTLMEELGLKEEDLLSLVLLFKPHTNTMQ